MAEVFGTDGVDRNIYGGPEDDNIYGLWGRRRRLQR